MLVRQLVRQRLGMLHRIQGVIQHARMLQTLKPPVRQTSEKQRVLTTAEKLIIMMIKQDVTNTNRQFDRWRKTKGTHHSREVDHLEQVWGGLVLVLLHPGTAHQLGGPDRSEQVKLQQRHLSRYLHWV